jgi:hypothetical protein
MDRKDITLLAILAATALSLSALSAKAQTANTPQTYMPNGAGIDKILPPEEFDKPFDGHLEIKIVPSVEIVRAGCPGSQAPLACTQRFALNYCVIIWLPDDQVERYMPVEVLMRHEMGHCNGWLGSHAGARPWYRVRS